MRLQIANPCKHVGETVVAVKLKRCEKALCKVSIGLSVLVNCRNMVVQHGGLCAAGLASSVEINAKTTRDVVSYILYTVLYCMIVYLKYTQCCNLFCENKFVFNL